jgi:hypothetical protein
MAKDTLDTVLKCLQLTKKSTDRTVGLPWVQQHLCADRSIARRTPPGFRYV